MEEPNSGTAVGDLIKETEVLGEVVEKLRIGDAMGSEEENVIWIEGGNGGLN